MNKDQDKAGANAGTNGGGGRASGGGGGTGVQVPRETTPQPPAAPPASLAASNGASNGGAQKPVKRSTGMMVTKEVYERFGGRIRQATAQKLADYREFCKDVDGREYDDDEILENALAALFSRAKGLGSWLRSRDEAQTDRDVDDAFQNLVVPAMPATIGSGSGAPAR